MIWDIAIFRPHHMSWLVFQPVWKMKKSSVGITSPNIWKKKQKGSKPPTSVIIEIPFYRFLYFVHPAFDRILNPHFYRKPFHRTKRPPPVVPRLGSPATSHGSAALPRRSGRPARPGPRCRRRRSWNRAFRSWGFRGSNEVWCDSNEGRYILFLMMYQFLILWVLERYILLMMYQFFIVPSIIVVFFFFFHMGTNE